MNVETANIPLAPKDYLDTLVVCVGILSSTGNISIPTFESILAFQNITSQLGIKTSIKTLNKSGADAKNELVAEFLKNPANTHLLFVDPEIAFNTYHALALLSSRKHIIGGLIPNLKFILGRQEHNIFEVNRISSKFMLVSKEAFIHLQDHKNVTIPDPANPFNKTFFDPTLRDDEYLNEDSEFYERWRDLGGKIWVHPLVKLK